MMLYCSMETDRQMRKNIPPWVCEATKDDPNMVHTPMYTSTRSMLASLTCRHSPESMCFSRWSGTQHVEVEKWRITEELTQKHKWYWKSSFTVKKPSGIFYASHIDFVKRRQPRGHVPTTVISQQDYSK